VRALAVLSLLARVAFAAAPDGGAPPADGGGAPDEAAEARTSTDGKGHAWDRVTAPAAGRPESIGGYSAGCVRGALELPLRGPGYVVMRPERRRVFGHPRLISFLRDLGARVRGERIGLLRVGDLGQPRGGPAPTGHASHQTGLDVDLWYLLDPDERASTPSPVVDLIKRRLTRAWSSRIARALAVVVADARVDRVFVNPLVKQALCTHAGDARAWLRKVRPWWAHHEHFHVRLACPADERDCKAQEPLPPGDGCDEVAWWFDRKRDTERKKQHEQYRSRIGSAPRLPARCDEVYDAPPVAAGAGAGAPATAHMPVQTPPQ
jgi:penicillin-insensitive murein DD-endopeptidase